MAEYSGEKELLGTGVVDDRRRATGGALPPDSPAMAQVRAAHAEAADAREKAQALVDPANRPPAAAEPPVPQPTENVTAKPANDGVIKPGEPGAGEPAT